MNAAQVFTLTKRIASWYDRSIAAEVVKNVWQPGLVGIEDDVAGEALLRYARKQHGNYPPSLDDLLSHCEEVEDERHRAAIQARRATEDRLAMEAWHKAEAALEAKRRLRPVADPLTHVLQDMPRDPWAHGHVLMHEKGVNRPGCEQEAAAFCWQMAADDVPNKDAWMAEGAWWAEGAWGDIPWSTPMSRGETLQERIGRN